MTLPFHTFVARDEKAQRNVEESVTEVSHQVETSTPATGSTMEDIIVLDDDDSDVEEAAEANSDAALVDKSKQLENEEADSASESEEEAEPMSLSDLSSSFEKCLPSSDQTRSPKIANKSQPSEGLLQLEPFDYESARKLIKFGVNQPKEEGDDNSQRRDKKKGSVTANSGQEEGTAEFSQGRRRQAFPASGNRSATFR